MSTIVECNGVADFNRRFSADMRARTRRIKKAIRKTARAGKRVVAENVPVAFGDLRQSLQTDDHRIFSDAPHAAAVENGSRPHFPPLEPLIAWVKLRGMQGLRGGKLAGRTSRPAAKAVRNMLRNQEVDGALGVDAPRAVAYAIALAISKRGTKPHRYMGDSVPGVVEILDREIVAALPDR